MADVIPLQTVSIVSAFVGMAYWSADGGLPAARAEKSALKNLTFVGILLAE